MILLCGIPSETPLRMVAEQLDLLGTPYATFNQRRFAEMALSYTIADGQVTGKLDIGSDSFALEGFTGVYTRLMDDQALPELPDLPPQSPTHARCRQLHDALIRWCEIAPCRVVNRVEPMGSNGSKPYQAQLILKHGFRTPETLITNDPCLVLEFMAEHKRLIYKSISGIRSIVQVLTDEDLSRLDRIRWCPTQFQAFVEGTNVRVHTVGERVFATAISTDTTDYRYAHTQGGETDLREVELDDEVAARCVALARDLGLPFAGIDLKVTEDQQVYCFEVNPSPAFSYYESNTGQPIAEAVARYLTHG